MLAEEQVEASAKEDVITALGQAASRFRETLGESLAIGPALRPEHREATTPSLEALKAYSQGMTTRRTQGDFDSVPFFRRAIELDPEFALAHARLGTVLSNLGERDEAEQGRHARLRAARQGQRARAPLHRSALSHDRHARSAKAIESYRLLLAHLSGRLRRAFEPRLALSRPGQDQGGDRASQGSRAPRAGSADRPRQPRLARTSAEGRLADARQEFEEVLKLQESSGARNGLFTVATLTGDQALADAQIAAVARAVATKSDLTRRARAGGCIQRADERGRAADRRSFPAPPGGQPAAVELAKASSAWRSAQAVGRTERGGACGAGARPSGTT